MGDIETAVKNASRLEFLLETKLSATGKGLHEKASSVADKIPAEVLKKIRWIATVRNTVVHEGATIPDLPEFEGTCSKIAAAIDGLNPSNPSIMPPPPTITQPTSAIDEASNGGGHNPFSGLAGGLGERFAALPGPLKIRVVIAGALGLLLLLMSLVPETPGPLQYRQPTGAAGNSTDAPPSPARTVPIKPGRSLDGFKVVDQTDKSGFATLHKEQ